MIEPLIKTSVEKKAVALRAKPKRPASVITSTILLGLVSFMSTAGLILAVQLKIFDPLQFVLAGLSITAFLGLIFRGRAHITRYVVSVALAVLVIKFLLRVVSPHEIYAPPFPSGSPLPRLTGFMVTAALGLLFWRYTFGKPSRKFYGLPDKK